MRKIFATIIICILFLLIKNENASSKGSCRIDCNTLVKETSLSATPDNAAEEEPAIQYHGFFFKI